MVTDGKPSHILTRLRNLNDGTCSDEELRSFLMEQLPSQVRAVLVMSKITDLHAYAEMADKVMEASGAAAPTIAAFSPRDSPSAAPVGCRVQTNRELEEKVERLTRQVVALLSNANFRGRSPRRGPPRRRRSPNRSKSLGDRVCRLHRKYGKDTWHCISFGKLIRASRVKASVVSTESHLLLIRDRDLGMTFLIDTGTDISLLPVSKAAKGRATDFKLYAANESAIERFGETRLEVNLGLRRVFSWIFCVAAVPYPIIGAIFLTHFGLVVDLRNGKLIDPLTRIFTIGSVKPSPMVNIKSVNPASPFSRILAEFPGILGLPQNKCNSPMCCIT